MIQPSNTSKRVAVIGAGPAGLMAAETLAAGGVQVDVYDAMPSSGRKFLLAGKGGEDTLERTHETIPWIEAEEARVALHARRSERA